jgi:3'(2'), 5'-bisphosphate nucleotidase
MNLTKSDLSPVTVADFALQALVARALAERFPGDRLVAEERSSELRAAPAVLGKVVEFLQDEIPEANERNVCEWIDRGAGEPGGRFWTLDPIDGTKGYLRGGQYAVALALLEDGAVQLGVLGCPNLGAGCAPAGGGAGVAVVARRGHGTWETPFDARGGFAPLHVSDCHDAPRARLLRSFEAAHTNTQQIDDLARALGLEAAPVLMDSQAKYAVLAAGHAELLLRFLSPKQMDYKERIWDHAAGALILEEAGGRITDLDGRALDFTAGRRLVHNRGMAASNARMHAPLLDALGKLNL